jgi:hypothetical protein
MVLIETFLNVLGVGNQTGNSTDFAKLWQTDRTKASGHLRNNLELMAKLADVFGCL